MFKKLWQMQSALLIRIFKKLWQMQSVLFNSYIREKLTNSKRIIYFMYRRISDKCKPNYLLHIFRKPWKIQSVLFTHILKKLWQMQRVLFTSCIQETLTNAERIIVRLNSSPHPRFYRTVCSGSQAFWNHLRINFPLCTKLRVHRVLNFIIKFSST